MRTFPTEEAAALALRGGPPLDLPETWEMARAETLLHWRMVQETLEQARPEEVLRLLTLMTALCERADEFFRVAPMVPAHGDRGEATPAAEARRRRMALTELLRRPGEPTRSGPLSSRCECCPLFTALGGGPEDIGCQSLLNPIMDAIQAGDCRQARDQVASVIETVQALPLPDEHRPMLESSV